MLPRPLLIGSEIYRASRYGSTHPLAIPRVSAAIDLCRAMGWLPDAAYVDSPVATVDQLARFHDRAYIEALIAAERDQRVDEETSRRYNIGRNGNPVFGEVFRRPATACGASLRAVELLADGGVVHSPASGTHHGRPAQASGFCFFNDPALAILAFLDSGLARIAYVDLDAHHGDGVEAAFAGDPRVLAISIHEEGLWPRTGAVTERAGGSARNLPVPAGLNDSEHAVLLDEAVLPLLARFRPEAIVLQCGADALADDPLSGLALSNRAYFDAVARVRALGCPRLLATGGGGYNPWAVARCWAGIWATLNGLAIPERAPPAAEAVLRGLSWNRRRGEPKPERWFTTIADAPAPGAVRPEIASLARATLAP